MVRIAILMPWWDARPRKFQLLEEGKQGFEIDGWGGAIRNLKFEIVHA